MLEIKIDEQKLEQLYMQEVNQRLDKLEAQTLFWDRKELMRQTKMAWNTIVEKFLYHPDFPKFKVGSKWFFPAREVEAFLLEWVKANSKYQNWKETETIDNRRNARLHEPV